MLQNLFRNLKGFKKLSLVSCGIIFCIQSQSYQGFSLSVPDLVNEKDIFSRQVPGNHDPVLSQLFGLFKNKNYKECYSLANRLGKRRELRTFLETIFVVSVDCFSLMEKKDGTHFKFSGVNQLSLSDRVIKKAFRSFNVYDLMQFLSLSSISRQISLRNTDLADFLARYPSKLCYFSEIPEFYEGLVSKVRTNPKRLKLNFSGWPCKTDFPQGFGDLEQDLKTWSRYELKGLSGLKGRPEIAHSFLTNKISKEAYAKFRRLRGRKRSRYLGGLHNKPSYVQARVLRNLFFSGKYHELARMTRQKKLAPQAKVYVVKALVALGRDSSALSYSKDIEYKKSKWAEEILLFRGGVFLRKKQYKKAEKTFTLLLANAEDLRLSGLFWRWVSQVKGGMNTRALFTKGIILNEYPFSYYGIQVALKHEGPQFFDKYQKPYESFNAFVSANAVNKEHFSELKTYYRLGWKQAFLSRYESLEYKFTVREKALFALVFYNLGLVRKTIEIMNKAWDQDSSLRARPFLDSSFSFRFSNEILKQVGKRGGLGSALVRGLIRQESAFQPDAMSPSPAVGLMQLIKPTAKEVARELRVKPFKFPETLYDPAINIALGSRYIQRLLNASNGYLPYALASYNAGPGKMGRWSKNLSRVQSLRRKSLGRSHDLVNEFWVEELPWVETRFYVKAILRNIGIYLGLSGLKSSFECDPYWKCFEAPLSKNLLSPTKDPFSDQG